MALRRIPASRRLAIKAASLVVAITAASAGTYLVTHQDGSQKQINISDLVPEPKPRDTKVERAIPADQAEFQNRVKATSDFDELAAMVKPSFAFAAPAWAEAVADADAATQATLDNLETMYREGRLPPDKLAGAAAKAIRDEASILTGHFNTIRDEVIFRRNALRGQAYGALNSPFQQAYTAQLKRPPQDRDQAVLDSVHTASRRVSQIKKAALDQASAVLAPMQAEINRRRLPDSIKPRLQAYLDRVLLGQEVQP